MPGQLRYTLGGPRGSLRFNTRCSPHLSPNLMSWSRLVIIQPIISSTPRFPPKGPFGIVCSCCLSWHSGSTCTFALVATLVHHCWPRSGVLGLNAPWSTLTPGRWELARDTLQHFKYNMETLETQSIGDEMDDYNFPDDGWDAQEMKFMRWRFWYCRAIFLQNIVRYRSVWASTQGQAHLSAATVSQFNHCDTACTLLNVIIL